MAEVVGGVRRRWLLWVVGGVVATIVILSTLLGFYVDLLWFREVGFSSVFWRSFWAKILLGAVFGFAFFALLAVNLVVVRRLTPPVRPFSPEQEVIERYRVAIEPYMTWIIAGFSALIALFVGVAASAQWQTFLLWQNAAGVSFGAEMADPVFGRDPSFYIFALPFQRFVQGWLFSALVGVTLIAAVAHYLNGGIRLQTVGEKVTPQVKAHLSVLLGLIFLVKGWGYWLGRFDLLTSPRGVVTGASYTDINAQLPALTLLIVIAVICGVLFLVNIRFKGWILPTLGIGLLALSSIVAGAIVPAIVQRFSVAPQEFQREEPFIERNVRATRQAFGLDRVEVTPARAGSAVTADDVEENSATIENIRLWDPDILRITYETLQRFTQYYEFNDVDVDRYEIDGERRVVMLSPRELSHLGIPEPTWQNSHVFFTHGYGAAGSLVNQINPGGAPVFVLRDLPPEGTEGIELGVGTEAQVYYGELDEIGYVIVGTEQEELNFPDPEDPERLQTTRYQGEGGIGIGSLFRRAVFAYRFRDVNLLISGLIDGDSRILINRDIQTRVRKAAPFLRYDADPYAAIVEGQLVYIWDAYTGTDLFPYSERVDLAAVTTPRIGGRVNYIRNSVKVVVDAYDGTVRLYVVDESDPLIQVWMRIFPDLFATEEPSTELREHFRYPENLLQTQAAMFGRYHQTDPQTFYNNSRLWEVPEDPNPGAQPGSKLRPYYVLSKLPGETEEDFVLFTPFVPDERPNMVAYLAAKSDPDDYGELKVFEYSAGENVTGPQQALALINQDRTFSAERTLLSQQGSDVIFANLFIVPIEDSLLYVQPVFVQSRQQNAIPELKRVVVINGQTQRVHLGDTLDQALALAIGEELPGPTPTPQPPGEGEPVSPEVAALLEQALQRFAAANELLRQGDLAGYQREIDAAEALIEQANQVAASGGTGVEPSPSPSPSPAPSPSPSP